MVQSEKILSLQNGGWGGGGGIVICPSLVLPVT